MSLVLKHKQLSSAIDHMLQGLVFWMGYKSSIGEGDLLELDFVHRAKCILRSQLNCSQYAIRYECKYSNLGSPLEDDKRSADLVISQKNQNEEGGIDETPICVMEFKMSNNTDGGIVHDAKKLLSVSAEKDRLIILLFLKPKDTTKSILAEDNITITARKKNLELTQVPGAVIRVRRITKAFSTVDYRRCPFMAFCIAVLD